MIHRRLYTTAASAGVLLAAGLALWQRASGAPAATVLAWAGGGFAVALLLALLADIGMRLQRRDIPAPRSSDDPDTRAAGRLDDE
jgi:hypothetical protein